jgi:GT2 family glycosyltransferase
MTDKAPKVTIIIPHYKDIGHLKGLLPTVINQTFEDYEVLLIDDASRDDQALEYMSDFVANHRRMRLLENSENLLFVRTCNKGIASTKSMYFCLLNSDTKVKSNFIQRNVEIMDADPSIAALSCIVTDQNGNNWFSGGTFRAGHHINLSDDFVGVRSVDFVAGTAVFYRRDVLDQVGTFDESFIMYNEDVEMCLRIKARTQYRVCMFADKLVTHYLNSSEAGETVNPLKCDRIYYYLTRSDILLVRKYCRRYLPAALLRSARKVLGLAFLSLPVSRRMSCHESAHAIRLVITGTWAGMSTKVTRRRQPSGTRKPARRS